MIKCVLTKRVILIKVYSLQDHITHLKESAKEQHFDCSSFKIWKPHQGFKKRNASPLEKLMLALEKFPHGNFRCSLTTGGQDAVTRNKFIH